MLTEFICDLGSTVGAWTSVRQFSLCECCGQCSFFMRCTLYMVSMKWLLLQMWNEQHAVVHEGTQQP